ARRAHRQPDRVDRRDHQRHVELHLVRDAREGCLVRRGIEGGAGARLRRGRSHLRYRRHRRRAQAHHHVGDRIRRADAVRQDLHRGHLEVDARGYSLRRGVGLPDQAPWDHAAHGAGDRAARPPDADSGDAPDRQRRGRDERGAGQRRRGRADDVLRRGRGRGAHRERGHRRPGRLHPYAHRRSRAPRPAPRLSARPALGLGRPADRRSGHQLLPADARARPAWRARRHYADPRRSRHLDRRDDPEGTAGRRGSDRYHPAHAPIHRAASRRRDPPHRGAANRPRQGHADPDGAAQLGSPPMRYISTRGGMRPLAFSAILLEGLAPDGGLAVPEAYPVFSAAEIARLRPLPYRDLAFAILSRYADDIPHADLKAIVERTYTAAIFGSDDIAPVTALEPGLHLLRVANGPTLAFKDIALQLLGQLFEYVL